MFSFSDDSSEEEAEELLIYNAEPLLPVFM